MADEPVFFLLFFLKKFHLERLSDDLSQGKTDSNSHLTGYAYHKSQTLQQF